MICAECGERPATVRYTEMVDGKLSTWELCEECARKRGVGTGLSSVAGPLVNILMGLLEETVAADRDLETSGPTCPQCGLSYEDFRRSGRLGCGVCYESFAEELEPLLRRVHGSTEHVGRFPQEVSDEVASRHELRRMRTELEAAVRKEDYERAAELRDLIRARERSSSGSDPGADGASEESEPREDVGKTDVDV